MLILLSSFLGVLVALTTSGQVNVDKRRQMSTNLTNVDNVVDNDIDKDVDMIDNVNNNVNRSTMSTMIVDNDCRHCRQCQLNIVDDNDKMWKMSVARL